jgi:hypothetical protein
LDIDKPVRRFHTVQVPMIAFAAFIIEPDDPPAIFHETIRYLYGWVQGGTGSGNRQIIISTMPP